MAYINGHDEVFEPFWLPSIVNDETPLVRKVIRRERHRTREIQTEHKKRERERDKVQEQPIPARSPTRCGRRTWPATSPGGISFPSGASLGRSASPSTWWSGAGARHMTSGTGEGGQIERERERGRERLNREN